MAESDMKVPEWITLTEGEEIRYRDNPSRVPYILQGIPSGALILIGLFIALFGNQAFGDVGAALPLSVARIGLIFVIIAGISIIYLYLSWRAHEYLVTSEEVYTKFGLVNGRMTLIPLNYTSIRLDDVKDVSVSQSFVERFFGYGMIVVQPPHQDELVFENMVSPNRVNDIIERNRPENSDGVSSTADQAK
ncbi:membrane-flanked domain-containing protein [Halorhabdus tiamatea SARL4B]|uniref:Membrane-flanked domain-containing protein n=1 Tax=Halorhabdus tiamatea SARL4B TaxID=1033806 RepID=U2FGZ0_9EURY|nr:PH domain-containing protein [Halorhabdus tiamatea]ERJ07469.1 membrane-flanked domain-containing protein [Halorhabdus tiamatea SARL4B]